MSPILEMSQAELAARIDASRTAQRDALRANYYGTADPHAGTAGVKCYLPEARAWIADCEWADDVSALTDRQVVNGVKRHYAGGWMQFIRDNGYR